MLINMDANNILYINDTVNVDPSSPNNCFPLYPGSTIVVNSDTTNPGGQGNAGAYATTGVVNTTVQVGILPGATHFFQPVEVISGGTLLLYQGTPGLGTLYLSISATGGTDQYGNVYPAGENFNVVAGTTNLFSVTNAAGQVIANVTSAGNITGQTITANTDIILGGLSLSTELAGFSDGILTRGFIPTANLPYPSVAVGAAETILYELDCAILNRQYRISLDTRRLTFSAAPGAGEGATVRVRGTTSGSTPTTASPVFMQMDSPAMVGETVCDMPEMSRIFIPGASETLKLIVCLATYGGFAGTVQAGSMASSPFNGGQWQLCVEDIGGLPASGQPNNAMLSGGSSPVNETLTFTNASSYSYNGNTLGAGSPGALRFSNGLCYQGYYAGAGRGSQFSYMGFSGVAAALAGVTVNSATLTVTLDHAYYDQGIENALLGWTTRTLGASSVTSHGPDTMDVMNWEQNTGATLATTLNAAMIAAFQSGGATGIMFGDDSTTVLGAYGYWNGSVGAATLTFNVTT
jgi:hypothetical protein